MQLMVQSVFLSPQSIRHAGLVLPLLVQPKLQTTASIMHTAKQSSASVISAACEFTVRCVERRRLIKKIEFMDGHMDILVFVCD
jgi:hypothetical protein